VNSASVDALTAVPGLDRRQALRIIANRPYASLEQVVRWGLSTRFIDRLAALLVVEPKIEGRAVEPSAVPATTR
jgi:DNA uptake protein ComE-like DNA-binding protein